MLEQVCFKVYCRISKRQNSYYLLTLYFSFIINNNNNKNHPLTIYDVTTLGAPALDSDPDDNADL